jgi:hypothetical protein
VAEGNRRRVASHDPSLMVVAITVEVADPKGGILMPTVSGYITLEKNITGLSLEEIEWTLGLPTKYLSPAAQVFRLKQLPMVGQFAFAGSTITPDHKNELVEISKRSNIPIPGTWWHQRLVKVKPPAPHASEDEFPRSPSPVRRNNGSFVDSRGHVEQWILLVKVDAELVRELKRGEKYWPPRS